jgi:hypothetical protein
MFEGNDNNIYVKMMTSSVVNSEVSGGGNINTLVAVWMLYLKFA